MKAFIIDRYASGEPARAREMPDPEMREDDVLIQIHAAGVNVLDSKIRSGEFKLLPPDPDFARDIEASWIMRLIMRFLSYGVKAKAKRYQIDYSFLFMRANGDQLTKITSLIDSGIVRPVVDRVFPFESTNDAMAYVESGRARGKVVIKLR